VLLSIICTTICLCTADYEGPASNLAIKYQSRAWGSRIRLPDNLLFDDGKYRGKCPWRPEEQRWSRGQRSPTKGVQRWTTFQYSQAASELLNQSRQHTPVKPTDTVAMYRDLDQQEGGRDTSALTITVEF
jgi:hypothetical protein